jgi:hypothetical protein
VRVELGTESHPVLIGWCLWNARDPSGGQHSYAAVTEAGPVLVDPNAPTGAAAARLWGLLGRAPAATVLTSDFHERDAYRLRAQWGTPVWGPAAGLPERGGEFDGRPDHLFEDGAALPGGLRAIKIDGGWIRGETVLAWRTPGGAAVLFTGDMLNGQANPAHPAPYAWRRAPGLYAGVRNRYFVRRPERMPDPRTLQAGLRRLLTEEVDLVCGGHGVPYGGRPGEDAAAALTRLLAMDWAPAPAAGGVPGEPAPPRG